MLQLNDIPGSGLRLCKWSDQLHLCSDFCSESDPDVVFDKNAIFLALLVRKELNDYLKAFGS